MELYDYQKEVARYLRAGQSVILQAPTGAGKTIAALWPFLEAWDRNKALLFPRKCIYSVPMRTLANQFLDKANNLIEKEMLLTENPIITIQTGERPEDPKLEGDLIFTTIDQTLSNFLGIPYALSNGQANLNAGAVASAYLVFDEFHLYGPEAMQTTLLMLKQLRKIGNAPFLMMTATFSQTMLADLQQELDPDSTGEVVIIPENNGDRQALQSLPSQQKSRRYHLISTELTASAVLDRHLELESGGRSIAICNTVDRAQRLFEDLGTTIAQQKLDIEVQLLHSRFYQEDRQQKETDLRREFGERRNERTVNSLIFVATQVVEVGLDITSDVLHTELAPANAILQRAGRCARYAREKGQVYLYQVPLNINGDPNYAPYHQHGLKDVCEQTWQAFVKRQGNILTFIEEQDVIQEAHGLHDRQQIEELRDNRFIHEEMMAEAMGYQERGLIRELIRDVNNKSIVVRPDLYPKADDDNPWRWQSFSLYTGSVYKAFDELMEKAAEIGHVRIDDDGEAEPEWVMLRLFQREDPAETYQPKIYYWWQEVKEKDELEGALVVAIHPKLARYTPECGLELAVPNDEPWQPRGRKSFYQPDRDRISKWETYQEHISRLLQAYHIARDYYDDIRRQYVSRQALKNEMAYSFARIEQTLGLPSGTVDNAARYVIAGHDVGKLNVGWQAWMHCWQEHPMINNPAPVIEMIARPDNDGSDEQYQAQKTIGSRPNHAAESAYSLLDLTRNWCANLHAQPEIKETFYRAITSAIVRHHTASHHGAISNPFSLDPHGRPALTEAFQMAGLTDLDLSVVAEAFEAEETEDLEYLLVEPDNPVQMLLYMLLSRVLRLADQRAASQV